MGCTKQDGSNVTIDTFTSILELYIHLVKTWEWICLPANDDSKIYSNWI